MTAVHKCVCVCVCVCVPIFLQTWQTSLVVLPDSKESLPVRHTCEAQPTPAVLWHGRVPLGQREDPCRRRREVWGVGGVGTLSTSTFGSLWPPYELCFNCCLWLGNKVD